MDKLFGQLVRIIAVLFSRKSHQAVVVHVNFQGIETGYKDIDTQIILKPID